MYLQIFDCIDLTCECGDRFKCAVVHVAYDRTSIAVYSVLASNVCFAKALGSAVVCGFLYEGKMSPLALPCVVNCATLNSAV